MPPPLEPPLAVFSTPETGVPASELNAAVTAEGRARTTLSWRYNCLLVETAAGHAVIDTGLGPSFLGYGPRIEPLVGQSLFGDRLRLLNHDAEILPGIRAVDATGHTPGHSAILLRRLLDRAADEHLVVHAYHLPFPGLGTITRQGTAYRWKPLRG